MAGLSDFRKKKLQHVFEVFFDTNKSGAIDKNDFEIAIENVCMLRGWNDSHPDYQKTEQRFYQIWDALKIQSAIGDDGEVSPDNWYAIFADAQKKEGWQQNYMNFMFSLLDTSGDGVIDMFEFSSVCSCYGIELQESKKAYMTLSKGNNAVINKEYFSALWMEYFNSEDPKALGNFIFGKCTF